MDKQECMGSCIKCIGDLYMTFFIDIVVNNFNNLLAEFIQIKNWWISVKTNGMELIAVL